MNFEEKREKFSYTGCWEDYTFFIAYPAYPNEKNKMIFEDLFGFPPNWRTRVLVFYFPGVKGGGTFKTDFLRKKTFWREKRKMFLHRVLRGLYFFYCLPCCAYFTRHIKYTLWQLNPLLPPLDPQPFWGILNLRNCFNFCQFFITRKGDAQFFC